MEGRQGWLIDFQNERSRLSMYTSCLEIYRGMINGLRQPEQMKRIYALFLTLFHESSGLLFVFGPSKPELLHRVLWKCIILTSAPITALVEFTSLDKRGHIVLLGY
jgi:hypothetical protein